MLTEENPYSAPQADSIEPYNQHAASNSQYGLYSSLKKQGTFTLLVLTSITFGIYMAFYIKRQTKILNTALDAPRRIGDALVTTVVLLLFIAAPIAINNMFEFLIILPSDPLFQAAQIVDTISSIFLIIWAFKARNRMNQLNDMPKGSKIWFSGLFTFLFTALYFNYKVNQYLNTQPNPNLNKDDDPDEDEN